MRPGTPRRPLLLLGAPQIFVWSQARRDRTAHQAVLAELRLEEDRVNVRQVLDGNLDRLEAPLLELWEKPRALIGERTGEQEGIDAKPHNLHGLAGETE
jgi:hypothetical protein